MTNPQEIIPGVLFYSYLSNSRKDKVGFLHHHTLVMQVSGLFKLETAAQTITMTGGDMLLIGKDQLGQITKTPLPGEDYETIVISLQEDMLRQIALEEHIGPQQYHGPRNILVPTNEYLKAYFQSVVPYVRDPSGLSPEMGLLKVKEAVKLLVHSLPGLKNFLFDLSAPHKIDLERFMRTNYHFNLPLEKFAQLTGRSLAAFKRDFQKIFGAPPRQWLQDTRLSEAHRLLLSSQQKASAIYLDLGFETLSHFSTAFKKKFGIAPTAVSNNMLTQ